jgi:hypothetical protein
MQDREGEMQLVGFWDARCGRREEGLLVVRLNERARVRGEIQHPKN